MTSHSDLKCLSNIVTVPAALESRSEKESALGPIYLLEAFQELSHTHYTHTVFLLPQAVLSTE